MRIVDAFVCEEPKVDKNGRPIKSTEKDILWICKGHYDKEKHKSLEEALDAYYRREYIISKEHLPVLSYKFMLTLWFKGCVKAFLQSDTIDSFWLYVIDQEAFKEKSFLNKDGCTDFYEVLYHRIVTWLTLLDVRDKDGNWKIDMSAYTDDII